MCRAILSDEVFIQRVFGVNACRFLVARIGPDPAQIDTLDSFQHHVVALLLRKEQIFVDFEEIVAVRVLQDCAREFYDHLADKRPRHILHEIVVVVAAFVGFGNDDVKPETQRAGHKNLVLIQLRHVDIQRLAWARFRSVKSYALDGARGLDCM